MSSKPQAAETEGANDAGSVRRRRRTFRVTLAMAAGVIASAASFLFFNSTLHAPAGPPQDVASVHSEQTPPEITFDNVTKKDNPAGYIAHAFGEINGNIYTNSLEAFQLNYSRGFRLFECDFVYLKDGTVFVAHDDHEAEYGLKKPFREATKADIEHVRQEGRYTPLTSKEIVDIMRRHPDILLILDTKMYHKEIVKQLVADAGNDSAILDRMVPHVSNQANYDEIMAVYPFKYTMLALYRMLPLQPSTDDEIIAYIRRNNITAVMFNRKEDDATLAMINNGSKPGTFSFKKFHNKLRAAHIPHYVHSVGNQAEMEKFRTQGVGVYMDIPYPQ